MSKDVRAGNPAATWASAILDRYPSGVDLTQLDERLRLTPTERLERMRRFLDFLDEVRQPGGHRIPSTD